MLQEPALTFDSQLVTSFSKVFGSMVSACDPRSLLCVAAAALQKAGPSSQCKPNSNSLLISY
jgi:hypothetical protein